MSNQRLPLSITVQPWYQDHAVDGKIVLPAVETMLLLAAWVAKKHPPTDIRIMEEVHFGKFLEIPPDTATVAGLIECTADETTGRIQAKLLSHRQLATMARIKEHGEIFFPMVKTVKESPSAMDPAPPSCPVKEVAANLLYRQLVPFGRYYHTLQERLLLTENQAWGLLKAPELPFTDPVQKVIGSPFPLDGALHAACVLGQQFVNYPPFPVGFERRTIVRPTKAGARYATRVTMTALTGDELLFDLHIFNSDGVLFEAVTGIRMRDVRRAIKKP
jgi:Polyketide synthase dehydratase